jgi:hypothetical protein
MSAKHRPATLSSSDASKDEIVTSASAWLPDQGKRTSRTTKATRSRNGKVPRKRRSRSAPGAQRPSKQARQWLPDPTVAIANPLPEASLARHNSGSSGVGPREPAAAANGRAWTPASEQGQVEELAELRRIEISALVRRVEELESELSEAKKAAANAKRLATRAKKAAGPARTRRARASTAKPARRAASSKTARRSGKTPASS